MDYSISKEFLVDSYVKKGQSVALIAGRLNCSQGRVNYWLKKHGISKRSISNALYLKHNPNGDPFGVKALSRPEDLFLKGLGLDLYWGEGTKRDENSVRLGNTDPDLILTFILFLKKIYGIKEDKLRFGLQIFNDVSADRALAFWSSKLSVSVNQFQKVIVSDIRGKGTYSRKSEHGVLTVYFNNRKLRDIFSQEIENLRK